MNKPAPVGIIIFAVVIVIASFMPWGTLHTTVGGMFGGSPVSGSPFSDMSPFGDMQITHTANAWNGNITLAGMTIPNWLTVLIAAAIAVFASLKAYEVWRAPRGVNILLALYGTLHLCW